MSLSIAQKRNSISFLFNHLSIMYESSSIIESQNEITWCAQQIRKTSKPRCTKVNKIERKGG